MDETKILSKEGKDLLLRELCARLPYGVMVKDDMGRVFQLNLGTSDLIDLFYSKDDVKYATIKPYLRPISSLTEEEMDRLFDILSIPKDGSTGDWIKINDCTGIKFFLSSGAWVEDLAEVFAYLNSIHVDYNGMIEKDLAIAVTKENNLYI